MQTATLSQKLDMDPRIKTLADMLIRRNLVNYSVHKRLAKMYFGELHREYYLTYIARARKHIKELIVSQNYIIVHVQYPGRFSELKYYTIGIDTDTDTLFINKIMPPPYPNNTLITVEKINGVDVTYVKDSYMKWFIFGYDDDVLDSNYTIDLRENNERRYRVQGDVVFSVAQYQTDTLLWSIARGEITRYVAYLLADKIIALLADHGVSGELVMTDRNMYAIRIRGGADSSRWSAYSRRNRARIVKILSNYFDTKVETLGNFTEITVSDGSITGRLEIVSRARFGDVFGDIFVVIREVSNNGILLKILHDMARLVETLQHVDMVRNLGNHRIELRRVIPISFSYIPEIKPMFIDPQAIYIIARDTFIVDQDSQITLLHKDHGMRIIKFAGRYILNITTTQHHNDDVALRNRVILSRIEPYKL
jgi:hypothetical protein